jgi:hypothetical protein
MLSRANLESLQMAPPKASGMSKPSQLEVSKADTMSLTSDKIRYLRATIFNQLQGF